MEPDVSRVMVTGDYVRLDEGGAGLNLQEEDRVDEKSPKVAGVQPKEARLLSNGEV